MEKETVIIKGRPVKMSPVAAKIAQKHFGATRDNPTARQVPIELLRLPKQIEIKKAIHPEFIPKKPAEKIVIPTVVEKIVIPEGNKFTSPVATDEVKPEEENTSTTVPEQIKEVKQVKSPAKPKAKSKKK